MANIQALASRGFNTFSKHIEVGWVGSEGEAGCCLPKKLIFFLLPSVSAFGVAHNFRRRCCCSYIFYFYFSLYSFVFFVPRDFHHGFATIIYIGFLDLSICCANTIMHVDTKLKKKLKTPKFINFLLNISDFFFFQKNRRLITFFSCCSGC